MRISKISDAYLNLHIPGKRAAANGIQKQGDSVEISEASLKKAEECKSVVENPRLNGIKDKIESGYYLTESFRSRLVESLASNDKFLSDLGLSLK